MNEYGDKDNLTDVCDGLQRIETLLERILEILSACDAEENEELS